MDDLISRQAAQHKINALIDEFETIMKEIRERNVDDSVCGLCEYDGSFVSDSGNWCNECPGFDRDDCFKLKDQYREEWAGAIKNLPTVQPTQGIIHCKDCKYWKEKPLYTYCEKMYRMGILDVLDYATEENDFCSMAERRGEA